MSDQPLFDQPSAGDSSTSRARPVHSPRHSTTKRRSTVDRSKIGQLRLPAPKLPTPAELKSLEHEGRARMADAKRAAGFELNEVEKHALKVFPHPRTLTIEGYA